MKTLRFAGHCLLPLRRTLSHWRSIVASQLLCLYLAAESMGSLPATAMVMVVAATANGRTSLLMMMRRRVFTECNPADQSGDRTNGASDHLCTGRTLGARAHTNTSATYLPPLARQLPVILSPLGGGGGGRPGSLQCWRRCFGPRGRRRPHALNDHPIYGCGGCGYSNGD